MLTRLSVVTNSISKLTKYPTDRIRSGLDDDDDDGFIGASNTQGFLRQVKGAIEPGARNDPGVVSCASVYRC